MPDRICFPDHQGVPFQPGPPTVDGYVEPEPAMVWAFGSEAARVDTGWSGAARETFGDATAVGLSSPLVVFQGLVHATADLAYVSFVVRRDGNFDDEDHLILVFDPDFDPGSPAKTGDERRIDISPVEAGVGAGTGSPNESDPWGLTVGGAGFKTDRSPRNIEFYAWDTGTASWEPMSPAPGSVGIRVRSWDGGTNNRNWSLEVQIPTSRSSGGAGWVDFGSRVGFFFDVIRAVSGTPSGLDFAAQFVWPEGGELDDSGGLQDLDEIPIDASTFGEAIMGSGPDCSGVRGVEFDGGYGSIGARAPGSGDLPGSEIRASANELVARVLNDHPGEEAAGVTAEFRIANWGIGPGSFPKWNKIPADPGHHNPSDPVTLPVGGPSPSRAELTTQWTPPSGSFGTTLDRHQCIWVRLDSNQSVSFVESSRKRNMNIVPLSEYEQDAEISGQGWPEDMAGDLDFVLLTSQVAVTRRRDDDRVVGEELPDEFRIRLLEDGPGPTGTRSGRQRKKNWYEQVFITIVDGYRRTGRTLTIRGRQLPVYAYSDSFGHTGVHRSSQRHVVGMELAGDGLSRDGDGRYRLTVPRDGKARLTATLRTRPERVSLLAWLEWLLQLLIGLLRAGLRLVRSIRRS